MLVARPYRIPEAAVGFPPVCLQVRKARRSALGAAVVRVAGEARRGDRARRAVPVRSDQETTCKKRTCKLLHFKGRSVLRTLNNSALTAP